MRAAMTDAEITAASTGDGSFVRTLPLDIGARHAAGRPIPVCVGMRR